MIAPSCATSTCTGWTGRGTTPHGVLVRYADDLVVMCGTRQQAEAALARLRPVLGGLGLELKAAKTRIVHLRRKEAEGFDFLGCASRDWRLIM